MFSFIKLHEICFSYNHLKSKLLDSVSAHFSPGWTSICGANGSGKTTLFNIIREFTKPESGTVSIKGHLAYAKQETDLKTEDLENFRYDYSSLAINLKSQLSLKEDWFDRINRLSIGEKKRLQIAIALAKEPDILLVDEPSNHIDSSTRQLLLKTLKSFRGVGLLISHDRLLLNELCTETAFLEAGQLKVYKAPYSHAKRELEAEREGLVDQKSVLKRKEKQTKAAITFQQERIAQGKKALSKSKLSKKDHDAKAKINLAKVSGADFKDGRRKKTLSEKKNRISEKIQNLYIAKKPNLGVFFEVKPKRISFQQDDKVLKLGFLEIELPTLSLQQGDRLAILGDNGAGKSTLLKSLLPNIRGQVTYAPQDFSEYDCQQLADEILSLDKEKRGKVFTLVSCLGSDPKSLTEGGKPSPGVWQKLLIAKAIVTGSQVLILDEPTNHMDLDAVEVLENALVMFTGLIIFISHDSSFVEKVATQKLKLVKKEAKTKAIFLNFD